MSDRRDVSPPHGLGVASAAALVVANMIGAGVFTTSGYALADLGSRGRVMAAWVVGGVIALCGALSYGALARRIPESGGEYAFLSRAFGPLAGFVAGWISLLAGFTVPIAIAALGLAAYLASSFGLSGRPEWIGTAAIAIAALMHGLRTRRGVALQDVAVAAKLLLIATFVGLAVTRLVPAPPVPSAPPHAFDLGAFAVTLVWISYSYSGWNAAVYVGAEVRDPERNVARALLIGTLVVTAVYLALNAVFVHAAPIEELAGRADVGAVAAEALGGATLRRGIALIVALALFTSVSSMVMAGPRLYARMAADGLLPRVLASGTRSGAPTAAVLAQAALSIAVVWSSDLARLLGYAGFTLGLSAAASVAALLVLRRREGAAAVPIPGRSWPPVLFIAATLAAAAWMAAREPHQAGAGLLTAATSLPVYFWMRRRRR